MGDCTPPVLDLVPVSRQGARSDAARILPAVVPDTAPSWRSRPRSSALTQIFDTLPSVSVRMSIVLMSTSIPVGSTMPSGPAYGPVCRPRMTNATASEPSPPSTTCKISAVRASRAAFNVRARTTMSAIDISTPLTITGSV